MQIEPLQNHSENIWTTHLEGTTQETTENSDIGYCTNTSKCPNVKEQNIYHGKRHYMHHQL